VANSSLDLSDRAVLGSLARLLSAVRRAAGDTPVLLVGAAARDLLLVHAWLLGGDARAVLAHGPDLRNLLEGLAKILRPEVDPDGGLRLVAQMPPGDRERQLSLLTAFCDGLFETKA